MHRNSTSFVFAAVAWLGSVAAQGTPAVTADPQGVVLDDQLRPIAGAKVTLVWEQHDTMPFGRAIALRLAQSPLPATQSGRDGGYVLPLTQEQRQMGGPTYEDSGCWLFVEKEGYHPWREPIPAGLPTYLGSRVLLRPVRADDVFADLPWPPAVVSVKTNRGLLPWLPLSGWQPVAGRRGGTVAGKTVAAADLGTVQLQVTAAGKPLPYASIWFDNEAYPGTEGAEAPPFQVDAGGGATVRVPAGLHTLRITAVGFVSATSTIAVVAGAGVQHPVSLALAEVVDLLAVSADGVPLPFVRLDIVPQTPGEERMSFCTFTDACGRSRLFLDHAEEWFAYADHGPTERIGLERANVGRDGFVRVTKFRPVTVRLRGNEWPRSGRLHWEGPDHPVFERAFEFDAEDAAAVCLRLCHRDDDVTVIGGPGRVPLRIRREDLPPMTGEPLLDLVALDRTVRQRAILEPVSADEFVLQFVVRPTWQADWVQDARDAMQFAKRIDGKWILLARDDGPLDLVATASKHVPLPFSVPARIAGADLPVVRLALEAR